jgi:hypothetical protein
MWARLVPVLPQMHAWVNGKNKFQALDARPNTMWLIAV